VAGDSPAAGGAPGLAGGLEHGLLPALLLPLLLPLLTATLDRETLPTDAPSALTQPMQEEGGLVMPLPPATAAPPPLPAAAAAAPCSVARAAGGSSDRALLTTACSASASAAAALLPGVASLMLPSLAAMRQVRCCGGSRQSSRQRPNTMTVRLCVMMDHRQDGMQPRQTCTGAAEGVKTEGGVRCSCDRFHLGF
jgi:hypothetical protein